MELPPARIQMSGYLFLCGFFFLIWERIRRQTYILQVRGLRPFILQFLVGRAWELLEQAAHGSELLQVTGLLVHSQEVTWGSGVGV